MNESTRDVGDNEDIELLVYGSFTDPPTLTDATVVVTVTDPSGATTTPAVSHPATGTYRASFNLTTAGVWYWQWTISGTVVDVQTGQVTAVSPDRPTYASLSQFKAQRKITATDRDDDMRQALRAASRRIDKTTGERQFYLDKTTSQRIFRLTGRVYCTTEGEWLLVDDIGNTTGMVVEVGDGTTWTTVTTYQTGPANAIAKGKAITELLRPNNSWAVGVSGPAQVRVTARWGWPAVPEEIVRACLLQANRLYQRKDSPDGVLGNAEWGLARVNMLDPDFRDMVSDYCYPGFG